MSRFLARILPDKQKQIVKKKRSDRISSARYSFKLTVHVSVCLLVRECFLLSKITFAVFCCLVRCIINTFVVAGLTFQLASKAV